MSGLGNHRSKAPPIHPPHTHPTHTNPGPTRVIPFDLHKELGVEYAATSPNLLAAYVRILKGEGIATQARATSQAFYVIRGQGRTRSAEHGEIRWGRGDLFVLPSTAQPVEHVADAGSEEDVALYHVTDEPLMKVGGFLVLFVLGGGV